MSCRVGLQFVRLLAVLLLPLVVAACGAVPTGPSLSAVKLTNLRKVATVNRTATSIGDTSVCCCHAAADLTNGNSVPVHVTLTFVAMGKGGPLGGVTPLTTVAFEQDMQPNTTVPIEAKGFLVPCDQIDGNPPFTYQLDVSSLGRSIF